MNKLTCIHINNIMNIAIITHIKRIVSNVSMHMFNTSGGISDNIINIVVINKIVINIHIKNTIIGTNIIVNNN